MKVILILAALVAGCPAAFPAGLSDRVRACLGGDGVLEFRLGAIPEGDTPDAAMATVRSESDELHVLSGEFSDHLDAVYADAVTSGLLSPRRVATLRSFGFRYDSVSGVFTPVSSRQFADTWDQWLIRQGIPDSEAIRPVWIFRDEATGRLVTTRPGGPVPCPRCVPHTDLLTASQFNDMVARGEYPLGFATQKVVSGGSAWMHDLGHFASFAEDPEVMTTFRKAYQKHREWASSAPALAEQRGVFVIEDMVTVRPGVDLRRELGIPAGTLPDPPDVQSISTYLASGGEDRVNNAYEKLRRSVFSWVDPVGGTAGDIPQAFNRLDTTRASTFRLSERAKFSDLDDALWDLMRKMEDEMSRPLPTFPGLRTAAVDARAQAVARVEGYLLNAQAISKKEWIESIGERMVPQDSPLRWLYCGSGVFDPDRNLRVSLAFCL